VKTGDIRSAGTDANVFLTIYGEKKDSGKIELARSENNKNPFERSKTDLFTVETEDIAKVYKQFIQFRLETG
jgi:ribosomal protein L25 (general stress protein Ctc)